MTIYVQRIVDAGTGVFKRHHISFDLSVIPEYTSTETVLPATTHELDTLAVLKELWNPATVADRTLILESLPKMQVYSVAGMIP